MTEAWGLWQSQSAPERNVTWVRDPHVMSPLWACDGGQAVHVTWLHKELSAPVGKRCQWATVHIAR